MTKSTKIWLITATLLILAGLVLFAGAMAEHGWDFSKLSTVTYETNRHYIDEDFSNISINTDTADILFVPSPDENCEVVCKETENVNHSVIVSDGTLLIELDDTRKWYENIGINFGSQSLTVYLPESEYGVISIKEHTGDIEIPKDFIFDRIDISTDTGDVSSFASATENIKIKTSTGNVTLENITADSIEVSTSTGNIDLFDVTCDSVIKFRVSTGKVNITDVKCKSIVSTGETGDMHMSKTFAEKISIERSTGDIDFDSCDATEIFITTDTGDVRGSFLTDKVFLTESDTGTISVPKTISGGLCNIYTDTGDITIEIK